MLSAVEASSWLVLFSRSFDSVNSAQDDKENSIARVSASISPKSKAISPFISLYLLLKSSFDSVQDKCKDASFQFS